MKVSAIVFVAIFGAVCQAASIQQGLNGQEAKPEIFEIDVNGVPNNGVIQGLRIRRSGNIGENLPEIDIEKIGDDTISVNGIRLKRSDLKDISDVDLDEESSEDGEQGDRTRRSGGGELLGFIGQKIGQKISSFASASSGHNAESDLHYGTPVTKAILSTLLQAVKAIKGGVIALGGQLIKAKGHLIAAKGKILASKGDSITDLGRDIAAKALLSPSHGGLSSSHGGGSSSYASGGVDHVPETGYSTGGFVAPTQAGFVHQVSSGYGVPSQHGYNKRGAVNQQFAVPHELPNGVQAGLLLLKPINVPEEKSNYGKRKSFTARDSEVAQSELVEIPAAREIHY